MSLYYTIIKINAKKWAYKNTNSNPVRVFDIFEIIFLVRAQQ